MEQSSLLEVQQFIFSHPKDWEKILSSAPYSISVSRDSFNGRDLILLKYSQIDSDFNLKIVRECRGLVLDAKTFQIVSFPFVKFGNFGEGPWVDKIDWSTAKTTEKIDGSLIKIVNLDGSLLVSSNGVVLADKVSVAPQVGCPYQTFGQIVREVLGKKGIDSSCFREGMTYMFELVSPWTRVVVPWKENDMYFLGCRDNKTLQETSFIGHPLASKFKTPRVFPLSSIDECLDRVKDMPWDQEGYVVVDAKFNRNKVKSFAYLAVHHLKNNGVMSYRRAVELVRTNEIDEVLAYFPELKDGLLDCKAKIYSLVQRCRESWKDFKKAEHNMLERKDKAKWILSNFPIPSLAFSMLDGKVESIDKFFMEDVPAERLVKMLGYKD